MAVNQFSIPNLVAALKKAGFTTKADLKKFATKNDLKSFTTKTDLQNFATKDDLKILPTTEVIQRIVTNIVNETVTEASDAILGGVEILNADLEKRLNKKIDANHNELITEIKHLKDRSRGLDAELSKTVTKVEHEKLKIRVTKLEAQI